MLRSPEAVRSVMSAAKEETEEKDDEARKRVQFDDSHDSSASEVTESRDDDEVTASEVSCAEGGNDCQDEPNENALTNGDGKDPEVDQEADASE